MELDVGLNAICNRNKHGEKAEARDSVNCCLNYCVHPKDCNKLCDDDTNVKNTESCYKSCDEQHLICLDMCGAGAGIFWENNPFLDCVKEKGCRDLDVVNRGCLTEKKDEIMSCCKQSCSNLQIKNCDDYCDYAYEILGKYLDEEHKHLSTKREKPVDNDNHSSIYFYLTLVEVLVVVVLVLLIRK